MRTACTRSLRRRHAAPVFSAADFTAVGAAPDDAEPANPSTSHEVAVCEQEPVALLEETRQTLTIIREKFALRSHK